MKPITIRIAGKGERFSGGFVVEHDGRVAFGLGWDEMLGHIAAMTFPTERGAKLARQSINKRVVGAVLGFAEESAKHRSGASPAVDTKGGVCK